jgi:hypothetical protein
MNCVAKFVNPIDTLTCRQVCQQWYSTFQPKTLEQCKSKLTWLNEYKIIHHREDKIEWAIHFCSLSDDQPYLKGLWKTTFGSIGDYDTLIRILREATNVRRIMMHLKVKWFILNIVTTDLWDKEIGPKFLKYYLANPSAFEQDLDFGDHSFAKVFARGSVCRQMALSTWHTTFPECIHCSRKTFEKW